MKSAIEDLNAFHFEAAAGQPRGDAISSKQLADWFWEATTASKLFLGLRTCLIANDDPALRLLSDNSLVHRVEWARFDVDARWWHASSL